MLILFEKEFKLKIDIENNDNNDIANIISNIKKALFLIFEVIGDFINWQYYRQSDRTYNQTHKNHKSRL